MLPAALYQFQKQTYGITKMAMGFCAHQLCWHMVTATEAGQVLKLTTPGMLETFLHCQAIHQECSKTDQIQVMCQDQINYRLASHVFQQCVWKLGLSNHLACN